MPQHCVVYSPASPHFSFFTSSAEVKRKGICQLHNHTTHPISRQQLAVATASAKLLSQCEIHMLLCRYLRGAHYLSTFPLIQRVWEQEERQKGSCLSPKVSEVLDPTSGLVSQTMCPLLPPPAHTQVRLGFSYPGRPLTEEREENNAPRPDVGGLMLKPRLCPGRNHADHHRGASHYDGHKALSKMPE